MKIVYFTKLYLLLIFTCFLYIDCTGDMDRGIDNGTELRDVNVRFTLSLAGEVTPVTRSVAFPSREEELGSASSGITSKTLEVSTKASGVDESAIKTLWLGQYDASGNLLISHYLTDVTGNAVQVQLKESPKCSLRFVGNVGDLGKIATLAEFNKTKIDYTTGTGGLTTSAGLPVNLSCANIAQLDNQSISINYEQLVELKRMVTKVQLNYTIQAGFSFALKQIFLRSVPAQIQCVEPSGQVAGVSYQDYTVTPISGTTSTVEWYLPENNAGIITPGQDGFASSTRDKKGSSTTVPSATYIELTGDATVNGVNYTNVSFKLYPGANINDYNLKRNTPYIVNLTLSGIDLSDPRVSMTVPNMVAPADMDAAINSTSDFQITLRPGTKWSIELPDWLSVLVDGKTIDAGSTADFSGPALVTFKAVTANPNTAVRDFPLAIGNDKFTLKQNASSFSVEPLSVADISNTGGTFSSTITATAGLPWTITTENTGFSPSQASGAGTATIIYTASNNSGKAARSATYTISVTGSSPLRTATVTLRQGVAQGKILYVKEADRSGASGLNYTKDFADKIEVNTSYKEGQRFPASESYCNGLGSGWRLPTMIELWTMYKYKDALGIASPGGKFWSSSICSNTVIYRMGVNFSNGVQDWYNHENGGSQYQNVRCVRTVP